MRFLKSQGLSNRAIGRQLGVNHQTINNELKRGTVRQFVVKNSW
nr:helix-turn-helix domain-containing protein [Lactobacillus johnsonii]